MSIHLPTRSEVHLSELRPDDAEALVWHMNDRAIYETTLRVPHPYVPQHARQFLEIAEAVTAKHGEATLFAIRLESGDLIGGCGLDALLPAHKAEIGYWIAKPYWGRGFATAALAALCDHAVDRWNLARISAHVFHGNLASARVLAKNGFVRERSMRKYAKKDGRFIDADLYAKIVV